MRRIHRADTVILKGDWPTWKSIPNHRDFLHKAIQSYKVQSMPQEEDMPMSHNVGYDGVAPPTHPGQSGLIGGKVAETDTNISKPLTPDLQTAKPTTTNSSLKAPEPITDNKSDIPNLIFRNPEKAPSNQYEVRVVWPE